MSGRRADDEQVNKWQVAAMAAGDGNSPKTGRQADNSHSTPSPFCELTHSCGGLHQVLDGERGDSGCSGLWTMDAWPAEEEQQPLSWCLRRRDMREKVLLHAEQLYFLTSECVCR